MMSRGGSCSVAAAHVDAAPSHSALAGVISSTGQDRKQTNFDEDEAFA